MKPPKQQPPVCCWNHTRRYMPIPETTDEQAAVDAAQARWDDEFYIVDPREEGDPGWDGRRSTDDLPNYVADLVASSRVEPE